MGILDLIGNTPLVEVTRLDTGRARLFLKLEHQNPGGSIKDRIALAMVAAAEKENRLQPGGLIVEATAGNTGLALALVAVQKGYRLLIVVPDKMSQEKIFHLRDLISRRHKEHAVATVDADETVTAAYQRMKLYDVSQVPVLKEGRIVGIITEEDILLEVYGNPEHFGEPVREAMESHLVTLSPGEPVERLREIFERGMVAIVMDGDEFLGLITRMDLLNWLRRRGA
jgi:CBS domain-containing protein